jgi:CRP/FNR family transcriptional regulator, cyclic AMP receptor protein
VNLPLNAVRLREMRRLIKSVREASAHDWKIEWLKPFMHPRTRSRQAAGVFSKGDEAKEAFVLVEGRILIPESSAAIEPGAIFGEMALFTTAGRRTASAVCASDVRLLVITYHVTRLRLQLRQQIKSRRYAILTDVAKHWGN